MEVFELGLKTLGGACSKPPPPRTSLPLRSRGGNQQVIWLLLGLGPGVCPTRGLIFHLPGMISDISTATGLSLTVVWTPRHRTADDDKRRQHCSMESATWIGVPWERASLSWSIWNGRIHCRVHVRSVAVGSAAWRHNVQSFLFSRGIVSLLQLKHETWRTRTCQLLATTSSSFSPWTPWGEKLVWRPGRFTPEKEPPVTHWRKGWVGHTAANDAFDKRYTYFLLLPGTDPHDSSAVQPVA
jgi:hypothetical protein